MVMPDRQKRPTARSDNCETCGKFTRCSREQIVVLTMDLHAQQIMGFFDIPVDHLYAAPVIYDYLKKKRFLTLLWLALM
jgi:phosphoribosylpyrophosphate synthetase